MKKACVVDTFPSFQQSTTAILSSYYLYLSQLRILLFHNSDSTGIIIALLFDTQVSKLKAQKQTYLDTVDGSQNPANHQG